MTDIALLAARLLLLGIFAVSGIAKLLDQPGSRRAVREFGVPAGLAAPAALLLPLAELAVAGLLLPVGVARFGALGALALLLLFSGALVVQLLRGRRPACHCFGQLSSEPVGWRTLVRNAALLAVAGFLLIAGWQHAGTDLLAQMRGGSVNGWLGFALGSAGVVLGAAALWLLLQLLAQNGRILLRLEGLEQRLAQFGSGAADAASVAEPSGPGLPVGTPAPAFQLAGLFGETLTLDALRAAEKPVLLTFVSPGCGPCTALLPDLARWQRELAGTVTLALLSRGTAAETREKVAGTGLQQVLVQGDGTVSDAYQANGTPSMVLVRADGRIGSSVAAGAEAIRALVARSVGQPAAPAAAPQAPIPVVQPQALQAAGQPCPNCGKVHDAAATPQQSGLALGTAVPALSLPDLDGRTVELAGPRGQETVVLLWNPGCGFCQQLLPELRAWEQNRPAGAPSLIVVSTGEKATNEAQGLLSPLLLDQGFSVGSSFGLGGTPSALLIDKAGRIASAPAVGGPAVMTLLSGPPTVNA